MFYISASFFLGFGFLLFSNILGNSVLNFYFISDFNRKNYSSILGLILSVLLYALIKSEFKTVLIILIPFLVYLFIKFKSNKVDKYKFNYEKNNVLLILLVFGICFLYQFIGIFNFNTLNLNYVFGDTYLYSSFSENLYLYGAENNQISINTFNNGNLNNLSPYHYPELWLTALLKQIFNIPTVLIYQLATIPILISIYFLIIYNALKDLYNNKLYVFITVFILLFVSELYIPIINSIASLSFMSEQSMMGNFNHKLGFVFIIILISFLNFNTNPYISILFLLTIPIFSISFFPAIYGGCFLYILFNKFIKNKWSLFLFLIYYLFSFLLFYYFFKSNNISDNVSILSDNFILKSYKKYFGNVDSFKIQIINFVYYGVPNLFKFFYGNGRNMFFGTLLFSPLFFIYYFKSKINSSIQITKLIFYILVSALLVFYITIGVIDNYQFYSNVTIFLSVFLIYLFIISKSLVRNYLFLSTVLLFCLCPIFYSKFLYINKVDYKYKDFINFINNEKSEKLNVLYFASVNDFTINRFNTWFYSNDLLYMSQFTSKVLIFTIANPEIYLCKNKLSTYDKPFYYNFNAINQTKKRFKSGGNILAFIRKNKINFLFLKNGAPKVVLDSFYIKDKVKLKNGIFYKINY
jgi:hypothetical protein